MADMTPAEFSSLAGKLPGYVITDWDERAEFTRLVVEAAGDINKLPGKWQKLMLDNRDIDLSDFNNRVVSSFGFDAPDPLMTQTFRDMGKPAE